MTSRDDQAPERAAESTAIEAAAETPAESTGEAKVVDAEADDAEAQADDAKADEAEAQADDAEAVGAKAVGAKADVAKADDAEADDAEADDAEADEAAGEGPADEGDAVGGEVDDSDTDNDDHDSGKSDAGPVPTPSGSGAPSPAPAAAPASGTGGVIFQFVVFPLIIVVVGLSIFGFFNWAFQGRRSYKQYLVDIERGWESERWQAVYELQFRLKDRSDDLIKTADVAGTIRLFERSSEFKDKRVRGMLAIALGHLHDPAAEDTLLTASLDSTESMETRLNAIYALGQLKFPKDRPRDPRSVAGLLDILRQTADFQEKDRVAYRKILAFTLGEVGDRAAVDPLARLLMHGADEVRWNAALALARFGDKRAVGTLLSMLDRRYLKTIQGMRNRHKEQVLINAISAASLIKDKKLDEAVQFIADNDPSIPVRRIARRYLADQASKAKSGKTG